MSRRNIKSKRKIKTDYKYNSELVSKFINYIMKAGKKATAEKIVYKALDLVYKYTRLNSLEVFKTAITNVSPILEVKTRRVGGANYQVPIEVRKVRRIKLSMRWIIESARKGLKKSIVINLASEIIDAYEKKGLSIKKRDDIHRIAESNKAFAHYKW